MDKEKERLKYCINRFDHYYDSTNNKGAVFLGLQTFIIGSLIASYSFFIENIDSELYVHLTMFCLIGIGIAILSIVILATIPFLSLETNSIYYFGSICCGTQKEFEDKSGALEEKSELQDLRNQVYQLSHGLRKKFRKLRLAGIFFLIQFAIFAQLTILLILNYKK